MVCTLEYHWCFLSLTFRSPASTFIPTFGREHNDATLGTNSAQLSLSLLFFFFFFFSYLFKPFSSACDVSENGLDVITNSVTSLLKPVIPSWLRWRYWFGWECMQINRDLRRGVVFQFAVCLWLQASSQDYPTHMVWLQCLHGLIPVF